MTCFIRLFSRLGIFCEIKRTHRKFWTGARANERNLVSSYPRMRMRMWKNKCHLKNALSGEKLKVIRRHCGRSTKYECEQERYLVSTANLLCRDWKRCASSRSHRPRVFWKVRSLYFHTGSERRMTNDELTALRASRVAYFQDFQILYRDSKRFVQRIIYVSTITIVKNMHRENMRLSRDSEFHI